MRFLQWLPGCVRLGLGAHWTKLTVWATADDQLPTQIRSLDTQRGETLGSKLLILVVRPG